jgi:hypothetical protein
LLDISKRFGGDCTFSALENRFRRIKKDAKLINDAIANGIDPITLDIGGTDGEVAVPPGKNHAKRGRIPGNGPNGWENLPLFFEYIAQHRDHIGCLIFHSGC